MPLFWIFLFAAGSFPTEQLAAAPDSRVLRISLSQPAPPSELGERILRECARPDDGSLSAAAEANELSETRCSLNVIKAEFGGQTRFSEINKSEKSLRVIEELGAYATSEALKKTDATESIQVILDLRRGLQNPLPSWQQKTLDRYGIEKMVEVRERYADEL